MSSSAHLEAEFPGLAGSAYGLTSPADAAYNCVAWAAGEDHRWWEPHIGTDGYWPPGAYDEPTAAALAGALATAGFVRCDSQEFEGGWEKVAIFAHERGDATHAARQLRNGRWTSKLGASIDIEHDLLALEGDAYGRVVMFLKRTVRKP